MDEEDAQVQPEQNYKDRKTTFDAMMKGIRERETTSKTPEPKEPPPQQ
jgi:hypothetical protein